MRAITEERQESGCSRDREHGNRSDWRHADEMNSALGVFLR
jgi:hypothetical protein